MGSLGFGYEGRYIVMEKVVFRIYRLRLEVVRFGDAGIYRCFVKVYVRGFGVRFREVVSVRFRFFFVYVREEGERGWVGFLIGFRVCRNFFFLFLCFLSLYFLFCRCGVGGCGMVGRRYRVSRGDGFFVL